jgi:hypothetical protein
VAAKCGHETKGHKETKDSGDEIRGTEGVEQRRNEDILVLTWNPVKKKSAPQYEQKLLNQHHVGVH